MENKAVKTIDVSEKSWDDIETLFGSNGACGGCWCMSWRIKKDEKWDDVKGSLAKRRFKKLITSGAAHGVLAYVGPEAVGWCSFDKRTDYFRLERSPSLACDDASEVWSIPCFYIKREYRKQGVAASLLKHAVASLRKRGVAIIEGYPVQLNKELPAAFVWTGTLSLFEKQGFETVSKKKGKQRVRLILKK